MKTLRCLLLITLIGNNLNAQITEDVDTIALARSIAYQKDFDKADRLLTAYNAYRTDLSALSLHAQVLYWKKSFARSIETYEKGIQLFPQTPSLHLEYARLLYNLNSLPKAKKILKVYQELVALQRNLRQQTPVVGKLDSLRMAADSIRFRDSSFLHNDSSKFSIDSSGLMIRARRDSTYLLVNKGSGMITVIVVELDSIDSKESPAYLVPDSPGVNINITPADSSLRSDVHNLAKIDSASVQEDAGLLESEIMCAYIDLWNGNIELARKEAQRLLDKNPESAEGKDIMGKIYYYTVPYVRTGLRLLSDDQPLKATGFYAEAGVYRSWLFAPTLQVAMDRYSAQDTATNSFWIQLANNFQFGTKNKVRIKTGVFQQKGSPAAITGLLEMSRQLENFFSMHAAIERRPYKYSVASTKWLVMENSTSAALNYNRKDKWLGKVGVEHRGYADGNSIDAVYAWGVVPVFSNSKVAVSGGYSFSYADARRNNFVSKKPISELIQQPPSRGIEGVYVPYFTPEKQMVYSVLAAATVSPVKKFQFTSRLSLGILAKSQNPYLWLQKESGNYQVKTGYYTERFMPSTWVNEGVVTVSDKLSIMASYTYEKLLFYKNHKGSIEVKYLFLK